MAYREFHNEPYYEAPASTPFDGAAQLISGVFQGMAKRQAERRNTANQFAYDLDKGAYENDTKILSEVAKNVTTRAKQELRQTGKISLETERLMKDGSGWQQASKNQMDRAKALQSQISSRADKYYNPEPDKKLVQWATHGDNNDVDFRVRGERLAEAEKKIGGIETFKLNDYRADYVKQVGTQLKEREYPLASGGSKTIYDQATFWDGAKPGVTDDQAIRYLESDQRVSQWYDTKISSKLDEEIRQMKSSGDQRVSWMKNKSDAEIKNELINDPTKNLINKQEYGVRVRDLAKSDLSEADRINSKVSYTSLQQDTNNSGGRWKNPNILHENTTISMAQEAKDQETGKMQTVTTYGPGGKFNQKNGKSIQIDTSNPVRTDIRKGITTRSNTGNVKLNMTGYQLMPVKKGMAPFALKSPDVDGMVKEINEIPLEYFDPAGKVGLQPEMKLGISGYTMNESGVLNDVQDQLFNLSTQIREATQSNDKEKLSTLENMEYNLNELKEMVAAGSYDDNELIMAANKAGVRKVQNDWIMPATDSDLATIRNITGGFNLKDKSYWSPEMQAVSEAYKARYEEAKSKGFGAKKEEPTKPGLPTISTAEAYNSLPSGSEYLGPDGIKRRKK